LALGAGSPTDSYSPDFTTPRGKREHVTIHDLAWLNPNARTPPNLAAFLEPVVRRAIGRAATVFTVSSTIRAEVLERFELSHERVIVATNAAARHFFHAEPLTHGELARLGVRAPFLLYVGTIEPRKNLPVLLQALAQLPEELSLVISGKNGWEAERQLDSIERLGLQRRVRQLGYVSEMLLPRLYASAAVMVYPSRYEGFGLPVVEGLAAGIPVVASDLPVFREVGGDQVTFIDPLEPSSLADGIERAISGDGENEQARERRQLQARRFDWKSSASVVAQRLLEAS
jgi:glycosyltransferase involved in cell wall biosynthesis